MLRALAASSTVPVLPVSVNAPVIFKRALELRTDAAHRARAAGAQTEGG